MIKRKKDLKIADVVSESTGQSWVYSDVVKDHFFNPRNLLLKNPKPEEFDAEGQIGSPACIKGETKIHCNPGLTAIENLKRGNFVLSHNSSYQPITRAYKTEYVGSLIKLSNQFGEIFLTPEHLIYAIKVPRPDSYFVHTNDKKKLFPFWYHAKDLTKGDICLYPIPKKVKITKSLGIRSSRIKFDYNSQLLPSEIKVNKDLLELAGYFISDGYTRKGRGELGFAFSKDENIYALRVQKLIKRIFYLRSSIKYRKKENQIVVNIYNIHLARLFSNLFGNSADTKHIPDFMLLLPSLLQRSLILGLWRGDGYINLKRTWPRAGYSTISSELCHQIKFLLLRQQIIPSIYKEKEKYVKGVFHQKSYRIHIGDIKSLGKLCEILKMKFQINLQRRIAIHGWFDQNYLYLPIKRVNSQRFDGPMFNLEISNTHTYTTDAFLAHNCGDVMRMWIKVDPKTERIKKLKWRTFGCGSAIATTSIFSVMVVERGGMKIEDALKIRPQDIMKRLGGLPARKVHCSVLADKAFRKTINNYFRKTGQHQRIITEGAKVIDKELNITDKDIEEAVLEGATDINALQKRLKVGIGNPDSLLEIEQLLRFYKEKYYGV